MDGTWAAAAAVACCCTCRAGTPLLVLPPPSIHATPQPHACPPAFALHPGPAAQRTACASTRLHSTSRPMWSGTAAMGCSALCTRGRQLGSEGRRRGWPSAGTSTRCTDLQVQVQLLVQVQGDASRGGACRGPTPAGGRSGAASWPGEGGLAVLHCPCHGRGARTGKLRWTGCCSSQSLRLGLCAHQAAGGQLAACLPLAAAAHPRAGSQAGMRPIAWFDVPGCLSHGQQPHTAVWDLACQPQPTGVSGEDFIPSKPTHNVMDRKLAAVGRRHQACVCTPLP